MNIEEELLIEHSKSNSIRIAEYIIDKPINLKVLIDIFLSQKKKVAQRAGMVVSYIHDVHPDIFKDELKEKIIIAFVNQNQEVAVKRNTVRILQDMKIEEQFFSPLFNKCLSLMISTNEPIAIRVFSMQVLYNICKVYPELKSEVILSLEDLLQIKKDAGIQNRGKKILKALEAL